MTTAFQNPAKKIRDASVISYGNRHDSLVVIIHTSDTPLPQIPQLQLYGHVFIRDASIDAVAEALDAVLDRGGKYFSGGIFGIEDFVKTKLGSCGFYFYGLRGAANMPLGSWLPYDFGAKASQIAKRKRTA